MTTENVRKAIVTSAYSGLEVVPDAFLHPQSFLATNANELSSQNHVATSYVKIKHTGDDKYVIAEGGMSFRYYGRGPEWYDISCF